MLRIDLSHAVKHFFVSARAIYIETLLKQKTGGNGLVFPAWYCQIYQQKPELINVIFSFPSLHSTMLNLLGATICHIFNSHQLVYKSLVLVTLWHIQICVSLLYDN
jgi:hypothetical protein